MSKVLITDDCNRAFSKACLCGDNDAIKRLHQYWGYNLLDAGLRYACISGHIMTAEYLISCGAGLYPGSLNQGLLYACFGGHLDCVKLMLSKGADNYDEGCRVAHKKGHKEVESYLLSIGARKTCDTMFINDWGA